MKRDQAITRDRILIGLFQDMAERQGWTAERAAELVGRSGGWGSLLMRGKIGTLQKTTRVSIKRLLEQYL